jgi:Putative sensor
LPTGPRAALRDPTVRRELGWVAVHATFGFGLGLIGVSLPIYAAESLTFPLWFRLVPPDAGGPGVVFWPIHTLADALAVGLMGVGWLAIAIGLGPAMARLQAWTGRHLLAPPAGAERALISPAGLPATAAGEIRSIPGVRAATGVRRTSVIVKFLDGGRTGRRPGDRPGQCRRDDGPPDERGQLGRPVRCEPRRVRTPGLVPTLEGR